MAYGAESSVKNAEGVREGDARSARESARENGEQSHE
jgi:hypothetical protein